MNITSSMVQELRAKTGLGIMKCKEALVETNGDIDAAVDYLRKKGLADAAKKAHRTTSEGILGHYVHHSDKLGVLVEVFCETDFVAKTDDFRAFVKDIAMHIASSNPSYLDRDSVPSDVLEKEKAIYREQVADLKKPEKIVEKIVDGKLNKFFSQVCLLEQPFVKQDDITVMEYTKSVIAKFGENVRIGRFVRMQLGE
ncbi:translation elongation factor Ts [bacterium]|nr:translation elongation factor Ts [candidate division CSSED10-310 bacterium]